MTTTQTTPISVHGLTKQSGRIRALEALTFEVRPGHITGLLGPNGAGKPPPCARCSGWHAPPPAPP